MSDNEGDPFAEAATRFAEGQNQFAKLWTDFATKMGTAGVAFSPDSTPPDAAKQMRNVFFKALAEYCDQYMRSPEFLDSWKQVMDGAIQFRRQMNEAMGKMHHEAGGSSRQDVDQMMMALSHIERRVVDTVERATDRLEEVATRVEKLEAKLAKGERKPAAKRKAPANIATAKPKKKAAKKKPTARKS